MGWMAGFRGPRRPQLQRSEARQSFADRRCIRPSADTGIRVANRNSFVSRCHKRKWRAGIRAVGSGHSVASMRPGPPERSLLQKSLGNDPAIIKAMEKEMGLRLEKLVLPFNVLVVDHVEGMPTGN